MITQQRTHIRSLFLDPAESYGLREVARLTGAPLNRLRREVAAGDRDASKVGRAWCFTWRQAVRYTMEAWTLAEIHEALGPDAGTVLPPLLALRAITVQLPEYIVRALETVAAEKGTALDEALHGELIDFAGVVTGRMEKKIPGYRDAYLFPGQE
jgi:hypothetical protein